MSVSPRWFFPAALVMFPAFVLVAADPGAPGPAGAIILDSAGYWRTHYTMMVPVYLKAGKVEKMPTKSFGSYGKWLEQPTPLPDKGWAAPDFDDSRWLRMAGFMSASTDKNTDTKSPFTALECLRGKFEVKDPASAGGMKMTIEYRGGIAVYLNGKEIARAHLAKDAQPDTLAESTQAGETFPRRLADVAIAPADLRKGVNVLAVECHRAAYLENEIFINEKKWPQGITFDRASCGVESIRLTAPAGTTAVVPNAVRPPAEKGLQVWNSDPLAADFDMDWGDPNEPLRPISLVGTPNGSFSSKVVAGIAAPIKGIKGVASDLAAADGKGRIAASCIQVRYATPDGIEAYADSRYLRSWGVAGKVDNEFPLAYKNAKIQPPEVLGALNETPPAEIPVYTRTRKADDKALPPVTGPSPVFGAVVPVWVTVSIPPDAAPGMYKGTLTVSAQGAAPVQVPLQVKVCNWRLPDPHEFRSFIEVVESPESLARAYDVPLWSDQHFKLIEAAFRQLGKLGNKVVYIHLMCETNMGNAESMVRWAKQPDGSYAPDFTVMDRYLDAVEKGQGKPSVVCLYLWDSFLDRTLGGRGDEKWEGAEVKAEINKRKDRGPCMTVTGQAAGEPPTREMPAWADPKSKDAWAPVAAGVMERMRKRGLEGALTLGLLCDYQPTKESAQGIAAVFPGIPWASMAHQWPREFYGFPVKYKANVFTDSGNYALDPSERRLYGWNNPAMDCHFPRLLRDFYPLTTFRLLEEMSQLRNYRGFVRVGADFWQVLKNKEGRKVGSLAGRFPLSYWNNLNIHVTLLAQGADGPVANARLEAIREGIQECEARIAIERALTDKAMRAKLGDDLADRCQKLLDDRTREVLRGVSTLRQSGHYAGWAMAHESWWQAPGVVGHYYYVGSPWQKRSEDLFNAAAEVTAKIGK
ncbi:MAG: glycoside hydrolase domain-containing protein [Phycisphaerae bacterium]